MSELIARTAEYPHTLWKRRDLAALESTSCEICAYTFVIRHSGFVIGLCAAAFNRNRFSRFIDRDQRKDAVRDAEFLARHVTRHPNFDGNGH
jgi:hypothetical protein